MAGPATQDEADGAVESLEDGAGGWAAGVPARVCRRCGRANPPIARFCGDCGAELPDGGPADAPDAMLNAAEAGAAALLDRGDRMAAQGGRLFQEARRAYLAAARRAPSEAAPLLALGRLCRANGRRAQAKGYYRLAARRDPACWQAWVEGSDCCGVAQDFRRAWWLGNALRAAGRPRPRDRTAGPSRTASDGPSSADDPRLLQRFLAHYGKLRWWERWLVRSLTGQPG